MPTARVFVTILLILASACPIARAGRSVSARVDELVTSEMLREHIPGVSIAVIRAGKVELAKGYGLSNVELHVPATPETIYQSGSVGKQFTATAVMMLVEGGKISLDDHLDRFFPDAPAGWRAITVRHLLTHTSGMGDYPDDFDFRHDLTEDELIKRAEAIPLAFPPGEKWAYSNLGFLTLGVVIHKVSGMFYGDFLERRVFGPLGMTTARVISEADIVPNRAAGYRLVKGELKNQEWVAPSLNTTADGALYLTVLDMAKWDSALYTEKLLRRSSLSQMWTRARLNSGKAVDYGFGWRLSETGTHRVIEHGGSWQGFRSFIARYPDDKLTVIVFANLAEAEPGDIAHAIAGIYDPQLAPPAAATK